MKKIEFFKEGESLFRAVYFFSSQGSLAHQENDFYYDFKKGFLVIADGFGGPIPGALASKLACESVRNFLFKNSGDADVTMPFILRRYFSLAANVLFNAFIYANQQLVDSNQAKSMNERGGASVLASLIDDGLCVCANVGVCCGWLFRDGKFQKIIFSKNLDNYYNPFKWVFNEAKKKFRNAPLVSLGIEKDFEPEIFEYKINSKDWLFFSTQEFGDVLDLDSKVDKNNLIKYIAQLQGQVLLNQSTLEKAFSELHDLIDRFSFEENVTLGLVVL